MDKLKKIIVLLIAIIIILVLILIINIVIKKNSNKLPDLSADDYNVTEVLSGKKPERLYSDTIFLSVDACVNKIISYAENDNAEAVYNILNAQYIQNNDINETNVLEKTRLKNFSTYRIEEIYELVGIEYFSYYVKADLNENKEYFNVNWDTQTKSYDLLLINEEEFNEDINAITGTIAEENKIERNEYNSIPYKYLSTDQDVMEQYFLDYIKLSIENPIKAYELLDTDYKNKKFGDINNFQQYIQNNTSLKEIYNAKVRNMEDFDNYQEYMASRKNVGIKKYNKEDLDNYTQYIIIDTYGNYYIFRVTAPMQYTVILDTYTIDLPEFIEKYNSGGEQQKVALNIDKFIQAINNKDYKYAYNCLADSYKNNYFRTQEEFENYAKQNFYNSSDIEYKEFETKGDVYTYSVILTNKETDEQTNKTFIMQLGEGTEFVMSFNK